MSSMETYTGHVRTPADAIILFEACRLGLLPRVQRRLSEKERQSIKSGSVFVWDEREAGMRRWTDGKSWSASRVSGSFLTYREMEGKRGGNGFAPPIAAARAGKTPDSTRGSDSDLEMAGDDSHDGYRYKPDGLMKQSFSITTSSGNHLHLISYYARSHPNAGGLSNPSNDPQLRHIRPQKGMYPESTVQEQQNIPAVTRAPMPPAAYSTVPQMAGYARPGPHPTQQQINYTQNGYNWAPNWPMQNGNGAGYHNYGHHYGPHNPPVPNEHSPLQHSQSAESPTSEPQQPHRPHSHPYDRSPYDRSPRPNDNLPPPPQHHRSSSSSSGHQQYRSYPPERSPHPGSMAPQPSHPYEHHPHHYSHHHSPYPQSDHLPYPQQQHYPPPQPYPHSQPLQSHLPTRHHAQSQESTPPMSKIDPRLMAPSPLPQQQSNHPAPSRSPSPQQQRLENAPKPAAQTNGISAASTIPSIGSIMNGPSENKAPSADAKSDRSGSKSPGGGANTTAKRDGTDVGHGIQDNKSGFKEDVRALRVLDRGFKA